MRKVIFALVLSLTIVIIAGSAIADTDNCSPADLNKTRVVQFLNGCGSYAEVCVYRECIVTFGHPCSPYVQWGYWWTKLIPSLAGAYNLPYTGISGSFVCMSNSGSNPCCASPCGYKYGAYEDCKSCNFTAGGASYDLSDYSRCSFTNGFCFSGTCDNSTPGYVDNQNNINLSDRSVPLSFNFSFFDNLQLGKFSFKICRENSTECFEESTNLTGSNAMGLFGIPSNVLKWVDERANGIWIFDISIIVFDKGGLSNESVNAFKISGEDFPRISANPIEDLEFGERVKINATVLERFSGVKTVEIRMDNTLSKSCNSRECLYEYVPSAGVHNYTIYAEDNGGNSNELIGTFNVAGAEKNCAEIGGAICKDDEKCENENYVSTTDIEMCCTSSCHTEVLVPASLSCSAQNGTIYDPSLNDCSSQITANDTVGNNKCCAVQPTVRIDVAENNVYWVDSVGNRIFGVWLKEDVKCMTTGNVQQLQITKDGTIKLDQVSNQLPMKVNELGEYVCRAVYSNGVEKESLLKVAELPAISGADRARLPGFGWIQSIIAFIVITIYGVARRK
ncbi:MAG: hypothetical protein KKE23_00165 [Nanoarchaeota archaeon]|nr:hypothetical protein [Nanoarchaeota archaeon]